MCRNLTFLPLLAGAIAALSLPSEFARCRRSDPDFDGCLKDAIQNSLPLLAKGLSQFNLDAIEPIEVPSLTIGQGRGAVNVVQHYKNVKIRNLYSMKILNVKSKLTDDEFKLSFDASVGSTRLEADYSLNGSILFLPIVGNGTCSLDMKDAVGTLELTGEFFTKKLKKHVQIKVFTVTLNPSKVEYNFRNLFNGDAVLGDQMNKVLNDNWREVFEDVKIGYEEAMGAIFRSLANLIFKKVPYDEIFLV